MDQFFINKMYGAYTRKIRICYIYELNMLNYKCDAVCEKDIKRPKIDFWIMIVVDLLKPAI